MGLLLLLSHMPLQEVGLQVEDPELEPGPIRDDDSADDNPTHCASELATVSVLSFNDNILHEDFSFNVQ